MVDAPQTSTPSSRAKAILQSELVKFILVGGFSAIVDMGSTWIFTFEVGLSDGWAKTWGFVLGTLTAYFINRRWTFRAEPSFRRFVVTMFTYAVTFAVQWLLYNVVCIPWLTGRSAFGFALDDEWVRLISFVIAQGVATIINFLIQKLIIFRK